jgi:hypothetical protein
MEGQLTSEQESRVARIAAAAVRDPLDLVKDEELQRLKEDLQFRAAVLDGKAYADRGEFIDEEEMDGLLEQMLHSLICLSWNMTHLDASDHR